MKLRVRETAALALCATMVVPAAAADRPEAAGAGQVEVVAGGIGEAEQLALAAREKEYNLKLVFSLVEGNYLADVDVVVTDAQGAKLIERFAEGPFVLARVPAGQYGITATHAGRTVGRKVKIAAGRLRTEYFRWPADPEQDLPVSRWLDRE